jgi:hypothetical protein
MKTNLEKVIEWLESLTKSIIGLFGHAPMAELALKEIGRLKAEADEARWRQSDAQRLLKDLGADYDRLKAEHEKLQRGLQGFRQLHQVMCTLYQSMSQTPAAWQEGATDAWSKD